MKITFIGAGSLGFTRGLVRDLLTFPLLENATLCLMDIDEERLVYVKKAVEILVARGNYPAKVEATLDRVEALKGADAVICTILAGGVEIWQHDVLIPKKYGVDQNVGDTRSIGGIFRALRTIPVMVDIAKDIERHCPDAIFLNYTNPMAMNCRAVQRETQVKLTGLCHSVQGTAEMLASWIGATMDRIDFVCAGINHLSWYLEFKKDGKDAYPELRRAMKRKKVYNHEVVRNEMFLHLGYYVTESSGHNSEYNWWFRKRPDLIEKYCSKTEESTWNPGEYALILYLYRLAARDWKRDLKKWFKEGAPFPLERGNEYAACIVNAYAGGDPYVFNGNVPNTGVIPNLPEGACVEVPVLADRKGFNAIHVGPLPPSVAPLTNISVAVEEMAVEAALVGDPTMVFHAACNDPLTASVLSLAEIRQLVAELLRKNKNYLPQFKSLKI